MSDVWAKSASSVRCRADHLVLSRMLVLASLQLATPGLSVSPFFVANGQPIQFGPAHAPVRYELIHQGDEVGIVSRL
jgi:hypothetical protein